MRYLPPALQLISSLQRLRDPQVQVWIMAGIAVLLVLIGHHRAWNASSEGKNDARPSASRLLLAGARVQWSEDFATVLHRRDTRPVLMLSANPLPLQKKRESASPVLAVRPAMEAAASQPWQAIDRTLRYQLSQAGLPASPLKIRLAWSGDSRGNAALMARRQPAAASPAGLVIGNGSRSGNGEIEWLSPSYSLSSGVVDITLIGPPGRTTSVQLAALAELLVHLEALSGHRLESLSNAPDGAPALML